MLELEAGFQPSGERRAALLLHSIPPKARALALAKLPIQKQQRMTALLDELQSLGIPSGRQWVDECRTESASALVRVNRLPVHVVVKALAHQSTATIQLLLASHGWAWRDGVAQHFGLDQIAEQSTVVAAQLLKQVFIEQLLSSAIDIEAQADEARAREVAPRQGWMKRFFGK